MELGQTLGGERRRREELDGQVAGAAPAGEPAVPRGASRANDGTGKAAGRDTGMQAASVGPAHAGRIVTSWDEFVALHEDGYRYQIDDGRLVVPGAAGTTPGRHHQPGGPAQGRLPGRVHRRPEPDRLGAVRRGSGPSPPTRHRRGRQGGRAQPADPDRAAARGRDRRAGLHPDRRRGQVDLYGEAGLRHYWVLRWRDRLLSVYSYDGTGLHLAERMSADRAVALLDPFPVVFRIEDLLLP